MNALNARLRLELRNAISCAEAEARVVVLTGAGRAFCSGQDLADAGHLAEVDFERVLRDEYEPLLKAIYECPLPTIATVNGAAAGAGANLTLAADVVIACESASFIQAFTRIGLMLMRAAPTGFPVRSVLPGQWGQCCLPARSAPGRQQPGE